MNSPISPDEMPLASPLHPAELGGETDLAPGFTPRGAIAPDALSPLRELLGTLRGSAAGRSRVGFLSHPPHSAPRWEHLAAQVGCEVVFLPQLWLDKLPAGTLFAQVSVAGLFEVLDKIAQSRGEFDVVLVAGLDLLLTRLDPDDCARFWADLPVRLPHRPRALILALPHSFARFGPDSTWKIAARLA